MRAWAEVEDEVKEAVVDRGEFIDRNFPEPKSLWNEACQFLADEWVQACHPELDVRCMRLGMPQNHEQHLAVLAIMRALNFARQGVAA